MGIQYIHLNVPEKLTIYDDKLAKPPIVDWKLSPAVRLRDALRGSSYAHAWLDLIALFRAASNRDDLYMKTDSHWTAAGAFMAYELICERIGIAPQLDLLSRKYLDFGAYFDLGVKMNPPVAEVLKFYDFTRDSIRGRANAIARYLDAVTTDAVIHAGSHVAFKNEAASAADKKILIFGDSYSSQRTDSLTGMLAESAREVEFIWSSNLDWAYIERMRPDVLVYELVERFMTIVPRDNFNLRRANVWPGLRAQWLLYKTGNRAAPRAKLV
jgi:alginate O-acetyltransferase complex protein AlgJ